MSLPVTPGTSLQDFGPPLPDKRLPVRPRKQRTGPGPPRGQPAARALPGRRGRACTSQRGTGPQTPRSARAPCHWGAGLDAGPAGRPGRGPGQPAASCPETSKASAPARVLSRDRRPRGSLGSPRPSHKPPWGAPRSPSAFSGHFCGRLRVFSVLPLLLLLRGSVFFILLFRFPPQPSSCWFWTCHPGGHLVNSHLTPRSQVGQQVTPTRAPDS